ncbi:ABC transporter substrate-binding protein [Parasphingopyxis algicola]|uniref:ABC transporter substrate-binding protein n=1 Tax=Parasphingopyxis algicola TaxID=2026624 RepID=UPI0015A0119E|nr:ABC transporter substrate-binding protein [Parasphingopyxis algicola]QLC24158.1 ABC transporter substrate-binding protein [Parasphingopyxis algicola]
MRGPLPAVVALCLCACLWFGLDSAAQAAPSRVVSVNMCTDELLLLLARPDQIASVTHLARDRHEFPFWRTARRYPANNGSVVAVAGYRPDLILTMGGVAQDRERLADRIGAELIALPFPRTIADIENAVRTVAAALDREERGQRIIAAIRRFEADRPETMREVTFLSDSGYSLAEQSLGAQWLALAGARLPEGQGMRVAAETLLLDPPETVIRSDYHRGRTSRGQYWLGFRFIDNSPGTRIVDTDGRRWTCAGPSMLPEIRRLRAVLGR